MLCGFLSVYAPKLYTLHCPKLSNVSASAPSLPTPTPARLRGSFILSDQTYIRLRVIFVISVPGSEPCPERRVPTAFPDQTPREGHTPGRSQHRREAPHATHTMNTCDFEGFTPRTASIHLLPIEILQAVFVECAARDLSSIILINKTWSLSCISCPRLWTRLHIDMAASRITAKQTESFIRACYLRSSGLLLDISLELGGFISPAHIQAGTLPAWAMSIGATLRSGICLATRRLQL